MPNLKLLKLPAELRARPQWAVSTMAPKADGRPDKAPRNPVTGELISSTDSSTWSTFEDAVNAGYPAIGYILSDKDPFTIIDLDDKGDLTPEQSARQAKIYAAFDSYAERSWSGNGVHIILRGIIGGGMNRDKVEVYDQERYIICTGDVCRNAPINNHSALLAQMVEEMGGITRERDIGPSGPMLLEDEEILDRMMNAKNADKFKDLFHRRPVEGEDWSQRDSSLAQMIAFHTRNHEQALRLFRRSALYRPNSKGKNPQHYEQYYLLERTFGRAWEAEKERDADVAHGKALAAQLLAPKIVKPQDAVVFPPGLVGEVAEFILGVAPRPVREIALAGALTFCSGLLGRQFNMSRTGLNLYIVLVAETGRGKEGATSGIDALIAALRPNMPMIDSYRGPAHIASGQALIKSLDEHPSAFAFLTEFGYTLRVVTDPRASASDVRTRQVLLDLFSKSGQHQVLQSSIYSDREKNTKAVQAPCFAFMGDTTPDTFYNNFNNALVSDGLLPRFLTITYNGPRVPANVAPIMSPSPALMDRLTSVLTTVANLFHSNTYIDIQVEPAAKALLDAFDKHCDNRINEAGAEDNIELWNRAHLKVLRLAGLIAVGQNHFEPIVREADVLWARGLVEREMELIFGRMASGAIGSDEVRQLPTVVEAVKHYLSLPTERRMTTYKVPKVIAETQFIPYAYFRRRFKTQVAFINDRRGITGAVKATLQDAVDLGILQELSNDQKLLLGGLRADTATYAVGPNFG